MCTVNLKVHAECVLYNLLKFVEQLQVATHLYRIRTEIEDEQVGYLFVSSRNGSWGEGEGGSMHLIPPPNGPRTHAVYIASHFGGNCIQGT